MPLNLPENSGSPPQRAILDALPVLVFLERAGRIVFANAAARRALGVNDGEEITRPIEDVLWGLFPGAAEPQTLLTGSSQAGPFHATLLARNGRMQPIEGAYCLVSPEPREAIIVAHPGGRERAPRTRLLEDVLSCIPEAVMIVHQDHVLYTNPSFTRMFGFTADEIAGASIRDHIVPETRLHEIATIAHGVAQHGRIALETVRQTRSGELVDVALLAGPLVVNGASVGYAITYRDIVERKQVEARLQHDAMHDVLTGLPNRALFLDRLTLAFSRRSRRPEFTCGVLKVDLDAFRQVNDALGYAAGDLVLISAAERMRSVLRPQDTASRLAADEFAVLVDNILSIADLESVAARVSAQLQEPYPIYGHSIQVPASIGVAMAGPSHAVPDSLLRDADSALYRAKQAGARIEVFDRAVEIALTSRQQSELGLRSILEERRFDILYEPIFRLAGGRLKGFEAILRFQAPEDFAGSSADLFTLAEETGLAISIGREAAVQVCSRLAAWMSLAPDISIGFNLSPRQFFHADLAAQLIKLLAASPVDPSHLLIEVAESTLNQDPDAALAVIERLAELNLRIALDDFGSVLAPLSHLARMPIDTIKLDPVLVAAACAGGRELAILESAIAIGRSLGIQIVAQGIETAAQLECLRSLACEFGQGGFLSAPLDADQARSLAAQSTPAPPQ